MQRVSQRTIEAMQRAAYEEAQKEVAAQRQQKRQLDNQRQVSIKPVELRGNNLAVQELTDPEVVLCGAAGTGKTLAILHKINTLCWQHPGARVLIVRKVLNDLRETTLVTFERDVLGYENPICAGVRRENRKVYHYLNGSIVVIAGMDRPGSILSGEYDLIYPAEAAQFTLTDWEFFLQRSRGTALPYQQVLGDTNPDRADHWLKKRADAGITKLLNTFHEDNPAFWNEGQWTERGQKYMLRLDRMTGVRKLRYREGKWANTEGAVYDEFNEAIHVIDSFPIPPEWRRWRSIDFGFRNPFVCQWWAQSPDNILYLYREIYKTNRIVQDHAGDIKRLSEGERIYRTAADHDAEDRATLHREGIQTVAAKKAISSGIQRVQARLRVQADGKPSIYFFRDALVERDELLEEAGKPMSTLEEIGGYIWNDPKQKDVPIDQDNHGMDAMRYAVAAVDTPHEAKSHEENPFY